MVNKEIISPLPLLYLYLSFPILIIIVTTTTIYPSLTLILLYLFNFRAPFSSPALRKSHYYYFTFSPNLFTLHPSLSLPFRSFLLLSHSFFFLFLFRGLLNFLCTPVSRRISGLTGASVW